MGIVVPGLIWVIFHLCQRDLRVALRRVPWGYAALLFLLVAVPWYLATVMYDGPQFVRTFFLNENLGRYAVATREGHGFNNLLLGRAAGLCLYPIIALVILFPCSAFLAGELFSPCAGNRVLRCDPLMTHLRRFTWVWIAAVIGLFALSKTQLPNYILAITGGGVILFTLHLLARISPGETDGEPDAGLAGAHTGVKSVYLACSHWYSPCFRCCIYQASSSCLISCWRCSRCHIRRGHHALAEPGGRRPVSMWYLGAASTTRAVVAFTLVAWVPLYALLAVVGVLYVRNTYMRVVQVGDYLRGLPAEEQVIVYHYHQPHSLVFRARRSVEFYEELKHKRGKLYNAPAIAATFTEELQRQAQAGHTVLLVTDADGLATARRQTRAELLRSFGSLLVARITPVSSGQWAVGSEQWAVGSEQ